jgi:hypothetical protein
MAARSNSEQPGSASGRARAARWSYDADQQILFVSHPRPVTLTTVGEIEHYFDVGVQAWREQCGGGKVYVLVDYDGLTTNLDERGFYATQVLRIMEFAITIVRYQGSMLQRMAARLTAIELHTPSHTYNSLEEALAVVHGLRRGTISVRPPSE